MVSGRPWCFWCLAAPDLGTMHSLRPDRLAKRRGGAGDGTGMVGCAGTLTVAGLGRETECVKWDVHQHSGVVCMVLCLLDEVLQSL